MAAALHAQNRENLAMSNGFFIEQHLQSVGNLGTISGHIAAESAFSKHEYDNGNGNNEQHNERKKLIFVHLNRFRRKYYNKAVLGSLVLLIIILLIAIIVISVNTKKSNNICRSKECLRTAASLIYAMDEQTDPCEDFYKFTCGHWADEHPRPDSASSNNWISERQNRVMRRVRDFLKSNITEKEPAAVNKAKMMYKSCVNIEQLDERDLEPLVKFMKKFELPVLPSVSNLTLPSESKFAEAANDVDFNWLKSIVAVKEYLTMDMIFGFDIFPDPLNRTINRIAFGTPETDSALLSYSHNSNSHKLLRRMHKENISRFDKNGNDDIDKHLLEEDDSYSMYLHEVIEAYLRYLDPDVNQEDATSGITEMIKHGVRVARKVYKLTEEAENNTKHSKNPVEDIVYISIADLQNQTDKLIAPKTLPIWYNYLQLIMTNTKHANDWHTKDLRIITSNADILYLQLMVEYLQETPPSHIESYLWLTVLEKYLNTMDITDRELDCAGVVNSFMGMATSYVLADDDFARHKLPRVERMLSDIRRSFDKLVRSSSWMDEPTKQKTMQKSAEMKSFIGFPPWLTNHTALNDYYAGIDVKIDSHLENMVSGYHWQMLGKLNNLDVPEPFGWATAPSDVNAYHMVNDNAITVPISILQYPFYDLGMEALNYGSTAATLGHELMHGFDHEGHMFDKDGNMVQWWSNETINEYVNRTECFVEQYSQYYLSDIGEYIDGELTLGENIADNEGMRLAYHAYKLYIEDVGRERIKLPGLEHYSAEQLFFIAFGNSWCETYTPYASRYALEDSHSPGKIRLKGVLSNSAEFARTFKCPLGSGMNPDAGKCRIW